MQRILVLTLLSFWAHQVHATIGLRGQASRAGMLTLCQQQGTTLFKAPIVSSRMCIIKQRTPRFTFNKPDTTEMRKQGAVNLERSRKLLYLSQLVNNDAYDEFMAKLNLIDSHSISKPNFAYYYRNQIPDDPCQEAKDVSWLLDNESKIRSLTKKLKAGHDVDLYAIMREDPSLEEIVDPLHSKYFSDGLTCMRTISFLEESKAVLAMRSQRD